MLQICIFEDAVLCCGHDYWHRLHHLTSLAVMLQGVCCFVCGEASQAVVCCVSVLILACTTEVFYPCEVVLMKKQVDGSLLSLAEIEWVQIPLVAKHIDCKTIL